MLKLLVLDQHETSHRGMDELEAGAVLCKANAVTIAQQIVHRVCFRPA